MVKDVLTICADFKESGIDTSGIQDSRKLSAIVALDGAVDGECAIIRVAETPPSSTASATEIWVTVRVGAPSISPGDDPSITEDVVVSMEWEGRRLNAMDFSEFRGVIDGWETSDKRGQFGSLYHNAGSAGTWVPARGVNRRRFEERFSARGPSGTLPVEMGVVLSDIEITPGTDWGKDVGKGDGCAFLPGLVVGSVKLLGDLRRSSEGGIQSVKPSRLPVSGGSAKEREGGIFVDAKLNALKIRSTKVKL